MKTAIPTILALAALAIVLYKTELHSENRGQTPIFHTDPQRAQTETGLSPRFSGRGISRPGRDGQEGTGTAVDPLNASTQQRFDALFKSFGPAMAIHLGPGAYHTQGGKTPRLSRTGRFAAPDTR